jgi:ArsR family transcriptional regulator, arsenate/arsenite/antimonite-responsive transcriptional repressor
MNLEQKEAVAALAALGHDARLRIYKLLLRAGDTGISVGDIGKRLDIPASTLAHHLSGLVSAGLVIQARRSRTIINRINFEGMRALVGFLSEECCADAPSEEAAKVA